MGLYCGGGCVWNGACIGAGNILPTPTEFTAEGGKALKLAKGSDTGGNAGVAAVGNAGGAPKGSVAGERVLPAAKDAKGSDCFMGVLETGGKAELLGAGAVVEGKGKAAEDVAKGSLAPHGSACFEGTVAAGVAQSLVNDAANGSDDFSVTCDGGGVIEEALNDVRKSSPPNNRSF